MQVLVDEVIYDGGTIAIGHGTELESGDRVTFGGDWRPMRDLADAVFDHGEILVTVEDWQVL